MDFNEVWSNTCSSIGLAAREGKPKLLKKFIKSGRPVDVADNRGYRPIHEAAASTEEESLICLKMLIGHDDTDVNWETYDLQTPLGLAVAQGRSLKKVRLLLEAGAKHLISSPLYSFPLNEAINNDQMEIFEEILKLYESSEVDQYDSNYMTALHHASINGDPAFVSLLLRCEASTRPTDSNGMTAVALASYHNNSKCLKLLLEKANEQGISEELVNITTGDGVPPLFLAAQKGYTECVSLLLKYSADPTITMDNLALPMHAAIQIDDVRVLKMLCTDSVLKKLNSLMEKKPMQFISPLNFAVMWESYKCLDHLLGIKLDLNNMVQNASLQFIYDEVGVSEVPTFESGLCIAAYYNYREASVKLLKAGIDATPMRPDVLHPLCAAILNGSRAIIDLLLQRGSDVNYCCNGTPVCLSFAIKKSLHMFRYILCRGADPRLCLLQVNGRYWFLREITKKKDECFKYVEELWIRIGHCTDFYSLLYSLQAEFDIGPSGYDALDKFSSPLSLKVLCCNQVRRRLLRHLRSKQISVVNLKFYVEKLDLPCDLVNIVNMSDAVEENVGS